MSRSFVAKAKAYYEGKLRENGPNHLGLDWSTPEHQVKRFEVLNRIFRVNESIDVIDYGCGLGDFYDFLNVRHTILKYQGYDVSELMVQQAKSKHTSNKLIFQSEISKIDVADYVVASGLFNVKGDSDESDWTQYVLDTLSTFNRLSRRGFAFNLLTSYSQAEKRRSTLYYAIPENIFSHSMKAYGGNVSLIHDYGLYDFTILVGKF